MDPMKLLAHDYGSVNELSNEELKLLISEILDIDEVPFALNELYTRDGALAILLGKHILDQNLGDEYLQAAVIDFFAEFDKKYLVDYIDNRLATMDYYIYNSVLIWLAEVSKEPFSLKLSKTVLRQIANKYKTYNEKQRSITEDNYKMFLEAYHDRIYAI